MKHHLNFPPKAKPTVFLHPFCYYFLNYMFVKHIITLSYSHKHSLSYLVTILGLKKVLQETQSVQLLSHVWFFATPWTAACQASLSITNSQSLPKLMSVEPVMPSNHLILCRPLLLCLQSFPASRSSPISQFFTSGSQSIGASASASVLPKNIQGWFPLESTGLISLQPKGLSRVSSSTTVQKHQFFSAQLSLWSNSHIHTWLLEKP